MNFTYKALAFAIQTPQLFMYFDPRIDSTLYGLHSTRYHDTKLWGALDIQSKSSKDLAHFKTNLQSFKGIKCKCNYCK